MTVEFESLQLLPKIYELLNTLANKHTPSKRWMSVKELSEYLTFGKDKIYKMVDVVFLESEHYYRKENRLLFDREKIDEWILNSNSKGFSAKDTKMIIDDVLSSMKKK